MATKTKTKSKAKPKMDKPLITNKRLGAAAAVFAGVAAIGAGFFFAKDKTTPRPEYDTLDEEGEFTVREYPAMLVAETVVTGVVERRQAQDEGFRTLADYVFAKSREGDKIAMSAPVLLDRAMAGAPGEAWRMRFIMPKGYSRDTLPQPPEGVELVELPERRVGAVAFSGLWSDGSLESEEAGLRQWLDAAGETNAGRVEYAFYDAPMIPGPLRRNEVLIALG